MQYKTQTTTTMSKLNLHEQKKRILSASGIDEQLQEMFSGSFKMQSYVNESNADETVIIVDGHIGRDYLEEYLTGEESPNTVKAFREKLAQIDTPQIRLDINSPGGSVNDALVIYDMLKEHKAQITTRIQGFSASAATLIALAGDKRLISETALPLVHKPMRLFIGFMNTTNLEREAEELKEVDKLMIRLYAQATNGKSTEDDIEELMNRGTDNQGIAISAQEYVDLGLADKMYYPGKDDDKASKHEDDMRDTQRKLSMRLTMNAKKINHYV